ncbi:MAG: autotransporter domain-containing protein [Thermoguttaceae bacterium]|nr:autotransporter domain-containing protein [Thermoguttaceae bacterium]
MKNANAQRRRLLNRLLFGTLVSSAVLLPGTTGYISQFAQVRADETESTAPLNVNVDATNGATLSGEGATGLTGANGGASVSTSEKISIKGGAQGVVGVLDETSNKADAVVGAVDLTLGDKGSIVVGDMSAASEKGILTVVGPADAKAGSTLTVASGANLAIGAGGLLEIGGEKGTGSVVLEAGSQLFNVGTSTKDETRGVVVGKLGTLTVGSKDKKTTGNVVDGDGAFSNAGLVSIFNESGDENAAYFGVYSDDKAAKLTATGKIEMNGGTGKDGALTINGALEAAEWSSLCDATFAATSSVKIGGLATVGSEKDGATLKIGGNILNSIYGKSNVFLGGVKAFSSVDSKGTRTGGTLTLDQYAYTQITGLTDKMDATGAVVAKDGKYDVWLDGKMTLNGTLIAAKEGSKDVVSTGIRWRGDSTISATGGLYAKDLDVLVATDAKEGAVKLENSGALILTGELDVAFDESAKSFELINKAVSSKGAWIESWTLGENQTFTNGVAGDTTTKAAIDVNKLTLSGGKARALGVSTARVSTLKIDADANDGQVAALETGDSATITVKELNLERGLAKLGSKTGAGGLKAFSKATVYNVGKADQKSDEFAQLQIWDNDASFNGGTVKLQGQGLLVQEEGFKLTFENAAVVNKTQRSGDAAYALSSDNITFTGSAASYSGGKTVRTSLMTFKDGATLELGLADDLVLAENGSLKIGKGGVLSVEFDADGEGVGKAVLSGAGVAELTEGSVIAASNVSALKDGVYSGVAIETNGDANVFKSSTRETAFYTLDAAASEDGRKLNVELKINGDTSKYAQTANQSAVSGTIEAIRTDDENVSKALRSTLDALNNVETGAEASEALTELAGDVRANSLAAAMNSPWRRPFEQIDLAGRRNGTSAAAAAEQYWTRGQATEQGGYVGYGEYAGYESYNGYGGYYGRSALGPAAALGAPTSAWFASTYRGLEANADDNSREFGVDETGMAVGYEAARDSGALVGLAFGFSKPRLWSEGDRVEASNFQLGLYGGFASPSGWETKFYVGGGLQDYASKRRVAIGDLRETLGADFDGQTLAAAIRLDRPFQTDQFRVWRPVVQVDFEQVWQDGATETGGGSALTFDDADWSRAFARVGLESEFNSPFLLFDARAFYGILLTDDAAPVSTARFAGFNGDSTFTVAGVDQGDSFFEAGLGARGYLDCERRWVIGGDYDFVASEKTTSHLGTVSLSYIF